MNNAAHVQFDSGHCLTRRKPAPDFSVSGHRIHAAAAIFGYAVRGFCIAKSSGTCQPHDSLRIISQRQRRGPLLQCQQPTRGFTCEESIADRRDRPGRLLSSRAVAQERV